MMSLYMSHFSIHMIIILRQESEYEKKLKISAANDDILFKKLVNLVHQEFFGRS